MLSYAARARLGVIIVRSTVFHRRRSMRRDDSKASFAIIRYNFRTYESGGVMAVIKGRGNAEMKIEHFGGGQSKEDRNAGWRYFLERTDLKPGMDPEKATRLRQARFDIRESRSS